jgi:cupin fold WbuC family metalloprotein
MAGAALVGTHDLNQAGEGIYYSPHPLPFVDRGVIEFLKHSARTISRRRARFCAHPNPGAEQHDMLIVSHCDTYVAPHRHMTKSESFVVLEGFAEVILFDEQGGVENVIKMGPASSGLPFFYRMPPRQFHSLLIESELLVFLESTKGPFTLDDREHADWAPHADDSSSGHAFLRSVLRQWHRYQPAAVAVNST